MIKTDSTENENKVDIQLLSPKEFVEYLYEKSRNEEEPIDSVFLVTAFEAWMGPPTTEGLKGQC